MPYQDAFSLLEQDPLFSQTQVNTAQLGVPDEMFNGWQQTLDLLSEIVDTPAILIMRVTDKDISVFTSIRTIPISAMIQRVWAMVSTVKPLSKINPSW